MSSVDSPSSSDRVKVIEYLISFSDAMKVIKGLKVKRHAKLGFSYELTDLNLPRSRDKMLMQALPDLVKGFRVVDPVDAHFRMQAYPSRSLEVPEFREFNDYTPFEPMFHLVVYRDAVNS